MVACRLKKLPKDQRERAYKEVSRESREGSHLLYAHSCVVLSGLLAGSHFCAHPIWDSGEENETFEQRRMTCAFQKENWWYTSLSNHFRNCISYVQTPMWSERVNVLPKSEGFQFFCFSPTRSGLISRKLLRFLSPGWESSWQANASLGPKQQLLRGVDMGDDSSPCPPPSRAPASQSPKSPHCQHNPFLRWSKSIHAFSLFIFDYETFNLVNVCNFYSLGFLGITTSHIPSKLVRHEARLQESLQSTLQSNDACTLCLIHCIGHALIQVCLPGTC